jgi:hypothetical protein
LTLASSTCTQTCTEGDEPSGRLGRRSPRGPHPPTAVRGAVQSGESGAEQSADRGAPRSAIEETLAPEAQGDGFCSFSAHAPSCMMGPGVEGTLSHAQRLMNGRQVKACARGFPPLL